MRYLSQLTPQFVAFEPVKWALKDISLFSI